MLCYVMLRSIILYFIVSKVIYIVAKQLDKNYNETERAVFYKLYWFIVSQADVIMLTLSLLYD